MTTITYEVRTHDDPRGLPLGNITLSTHDTVEAAVAWMDDEERRFARSPYATGGAYLPRIVVRCDSEGSAWEGTAEQRVIIEPRPTYR